ncbi:hypothetical protein [Parasitella parasitica]|uniref:Uncharacterized protein n=1 Tax=Parasitella parasitica TaxID=35722 RepID=A0A0B7NG88_9FUNG|nr:hypothetical protein [Parasitella parasitica]
MVWGGNDGAVDRWVKQLEENDRKLVSLHILSFRRISTIELGRIFDAISTNTVLEDLYVSGHALDAACMNQLSEALTLNNTLRTLNLGDTSFGLHADVFGLFCEGLAANEGLLKLDLENKGLKHATIRLLAEALKKNKHLESINVSRNDLDDEAVEILAPCLTRLKTVNMAINHIGAAGAKTIAEKMLGPSSQIEELELSDNPLLEGASVLASALKDNRRLRVLKMVDVVSNEQELTSLPPSALGEAVEGGKLDDEEEHKKRKNSDQTRALHGNALAEAVGRALEINTALTCLWLDNNAIESSALNHLAANLGKSGLLELKLRQNRLEDEAALLLADAIDGLQHLELGENGVSAKGFGALLDTKLDYLGLFSNTVGGFGSDPSLLPQLLSSKISRLDIGCNGIVHQDVEAIVQVLINKGVPELRLLEMGGNVEDKEIEQWENTLKRLLSERDKLEVIWKRKPSEMDASRLPPPPPTPMM